MRVSSGTPEGKADSAPPMPPVELLEEAKKTSLCQTTGERSKDTTILRTRTRRDMTHRVHIKPKT